MSLLEIAKSLLRSHRSLPKKAFGQNFMIESAIYEQMTAHALLNKNDTVLDIGAGLGFLTRFMASRCGKVVAVETDRGLTNILREQCSGLPNVKVIEANIFDADIPKFNKIVATPPYNISSHLHLWVLNQSFDCAVLVLQKEFAARLTASVGSEDYSWLTVLTYWLAEVKLFEDVPKSMFYPQPKVDSVITYMTLRRTVPEALEKSATFKRLLQMLFTHRNRKVKSAVLPYLTIVWRATKRDALDIAEALPFSDKRIRELAPKDFGVLADALSQKGLL